MIKMAGSETPQSGPFSQSCTQLFIFRYLINQLNKIKNVVRELYQRCQLQKFPMVESTSPNTAPAGLFFFIFYAARYPFKSKGPFRIFLSVSVHGPIFTTSRHVTWKLTLSVFDIINDLGTWKNSRIRSNFGTLKLEKERGRGRGRE